MNNKIAKIPPRAPRTSNPIPTPSNEQLALHLSKWNELENYPLQEEALNKLFEKLCPENTDMADVLLKSAALNHFYSTNIFSIYPVAMHICALNVDSRLRAGDTTLIRDIQRVTIGSTQKNFYSFATKYCSHHNPNAYPIYDSYVDKMLRYFKKRDSFAAFTDGDLKNYTVFKSVLCDFQIFYHLEKYSLKQIDQYLWLLGKAYFPNHYGKKDSVKSKREEQQDGSH